MPDVDPAAADMPSGPAGMWLGIVDRGHDLIAGRLDARKKQHVEDVLHQLEADLAPLVAPLVQQVIDNPAASEQIKGLLAEAGMPAHQFGSLVVGFAIGSIVGPALGAALQPEIEGIANHAWSLNPSRYISAEVAAAAVLKGVFTQAHGNDIAKQTGYNVDQFDHLVQTAGQSIGIAEALLLWRRGQITDAHLAQIVEYSNVNPRFYDDIPKLRYAPPTPGEVVTGALKGHLTDAEAIVKLEHAGLDPAEYPWLKASAGRPISPMEALDLWNRGLIPESRVDQAVAQSDVNTDYLPDIKLLREWFPPPRSVAAMHRAGALTDAEALDAFRKNGVPDLYAQAMIKEVKATTTAQVKELSASQVTRMYTARLLTRADAHARLLLLKYDDANANLLLDFADDTRHEQLLNATIRKVGTLYVAHKLSKVDAVTALNDAAVPTAAQHDLFTLWDIERTATVHLPTAAAVIGAYRRTEIGAAETKRRLLELGVQPSDLAIFVADGWPPTKEAQALAAALAVVNA